jgi:murein DD-endopeptidase MepM/ murein hydrolase activator NlpD
MKRKALTAVAGIGVAALLASGAALCVWEGPRDLAQYPPPSESPYLLPWTPGVTYRCVQGNRGVISHSGRQEFAYDFAMPVGSDICASRAGIVVRVRDDQDGNGYKRPNNYVVIRHDDGTCGHYLHIRKGGSRVRVGNTIEQGQVIAASGNVGNSMMPHLHFHVTAPEMNRTLPITFRDVTSGAGIPRTLHGYFSGNPAVDVHPAIRTTAEPGEGNP